MSRASSAPAVRRDGAAVLGCGSDSPVSVASSARRVPSRTRQSAGTAAPVPSSAAASETTSPGTSWSHGTGRQWPPRRVGTSLAAALPPSPSSLCMADAAAMACETAPTCMTTSMVSPMAVPFQFCSRRASSCEKALNTWVRGAR